MNTRFRGSENLLLVDFANMAYMACLGTNTPHDAVVHVAASLEKLKIRHQTERVVLFHDGPPPRWRSEYLPEYKKQREDNKDLQRNREIVQATLPVLKDLVKGLGYVYIEVPGVEADDLIGISAFRLNYAFPKYRLIIASADHDFYSLLDYADVYHPRTMELVTVEDFEYKYGIVPSLWPEVKALMGDVSDNYKGFKGIGEKNALQAVKAGVRASTPREEWPEAYRAGKWQQDLPLELHLGLYIMTIPLHENSLPTHIQEPVAKAVDSQLYRAAVGNILPEVPKDREDALSKAGMHYLFKTVYSGSVSRLE